MKTIAELLAWVDEKRDPRASPSTRTSALVDRMPWIHRTGKPKHPWLEVFEQDRVAATPRDTDLEKRHAPSALAFAFLGAAAFPQGHTAIVFAPRLHRSLRGTFTPFDTGGLLKGRFSNVNGVVDEAEAEPLLLSLRGDLADVSAFAVAWIDALFDEPEAYVERPIVSEPDRPALHGLRTTNGCDRLAWTLEAQVDGDIPMTDETVVDVLCARRVVALQLPSRWRRRARVPADDIEDDDPFERFVAVRVRRMLGS